jgi:hypothetical protein
MWGVRAPRSDTTNSNTKVNQFRRVSLGFAPVAALDPNADSLALYAAVPVSVIEPPTWWRGRLQADHLDGVGRYPTRRRKAARPHKQHHPNGTVLLASLYPVPAPFGSLQ